MEREANYTAVGAFVLLVMAMAGAVRVLVHGQREQRDYTRYEIYFDGSVSGLDARRSGALPRRERRPRGAHVHRPAQRSRVQVIVDIDSSAPVSAAPWRSCRCRA